MKKRTLYQVRHHANNGLSIGRHVGFKARLLPRRMAHRVAARLRAAGLFITCDRITVNCTAAQVSYLDRRYA